LADGLTTTTTVATIPNATKIATDDAGAAGHVQIVKLAIATDGSATAFPGDATDGLLVNLGTNNDVTVTGTVTEASGAAIAASLSVVDDWDESDRAKVNLIAGQAGVAGGTGTDGATVPRVTLATNVALPAGTNLLGKVGIDQTTVGTTDSVTVKSKSIYQKQLTGSAVSVISTATDIAAGNFSGAPAATFTNADAAVPGAPYAKAMAEFPDWAAAPVLGTTVDLYGVLKDVDSTDDDTDAPATTVNGGARYFGSWIVAATDALQRRTITISLLGITEEMSVDFYIKNGTAQNMNNDAGTSCIVKITPFTITSVG
jgi:hypothetical protein